jgi:undecaprenyl phosphate N,N'-diacetylbacillosamine 1-phosphate transferase
MYNLFFKRIFDLNEFLDALILQMSLFLVLSILVGIKLGRPIFFSQITLGLHRKLLAMTKFRTMTAEWIENGMFFPNKQRMIRFGVSLRSFFSLNEHPVLFNVLKGEITLVYQRSLLIDYLPCFRDVQNHKHDVRPGITGWLQMNKRNEIS